MLKKQNKTNKINQPTNQPDKIKPRIYFSSTMLLPLEPTSSFLYTMTVSNAYHKSQSLLVSLPKAPSGFLLCLG
jgi:hypothetical protein